MRARVGVDGVVCVGSHGLELEPQADRWRRTLAAFAADAPWPPERDRGEGPRGRLPLPRAVRTSSEAVRELDAIAESARDEGLVARYGRKVLEVLPPVGSHKGTAVRQLLEEHGLRRRSRRATTRPTSTPSPRSTGSRSRCASPSRRPRRRARCSTPPTSSSSRPTSSSRSCAGSNRHGRTGHAQVPGTGPVRKRQRRPASPYNQAPTPLSGTWPGAWHRDLSGRDGLRYALCTRTAVP